MEIDETKYGYVYRITNLINGKTYIGQHKIVKSENWLSYMGSGRLIRHAIHKYGIDNFSKELITYAKLKEELNSLEKQFIQKELLNGKSEYNIMGSEEAISAKIKDSEFTDEQLLSWYFDENMTYAEIGYKLGCSITVVQRYMKELKKTDTRFKNIKQGDNRGRWRFSEEGYKKAFEITHKVIECENCLRKITYMNYQNHYKACISDDYHNGSRKHKCANENCDVIIYKKNIHCKKHYLSNGFQGTSNSDSVKLGGIVASHNRWHVKRNKPNENCELCQKDLSK